MESDRNLRIVDKDATKGSALPLAIHDFRRWNDQLSLELVLLYIGSSFFVLFSSLISWSRRDSKTAYTPNDLVYDDLYFEANQTLLQPRANATFVILARNSDLDGVIKSVRSIEERFNKHRGYPYVFLNDAPFLEEFKRRITAVSKARMDFGVIPKDHWKQPKWIDEDKAAMEREGLHRAGIMNGDSVSYRNMYRFNSGFFFKHELLQEYRWYWRIQPDVDFCCDITFDPFIFMRDNEKVYGFTMSMPEFEETVPSLWNHVQEFMNLHPEHIVENNSIDFVSDDGGKTYNLCHYRNDFEIADMEFWRAPAYTTFFDHLDSKGGFYYERWGDAPVHSIAVSLLARKEQLHYFDRIGYYHLPFIHCPERAERRKKGNCTCSPVDFDHYSHSCSKRWNRVNKINGRR